MKKFYFVKWTQTAEGLKSRDVISLIEAPTSKDAAKMLFEGEDYFADRGTVVSVASVPTSLREVLNAAVVSKDVYHLDGLGFFTTEYEYVPPTEGEVRMRT